MSHAFYVPGIELGARNNMNKKGSSSSVSSQQINVYVAILYSVIDVVI